MIDGLPPPCEGLSDALTRRQFLGRAVGLAAAANLPLAGAESPGPAQKSLRAAIIGDTGHGDLPNVAQTVQLFERAGAAGMLLEDQFSSRL